MAYFLDSFADLAQSLLGSLDPKELVKRALSDKESTASRERIIDALSKLGEDGVPYLRTIAKRSKDPHTREYAAARLRGLGPKG